MSGGGGGVFSPATLKPSDVSKLGKMKRERIVCATGKKGLLGSSPTTQWGGEYQWV